MKYCPYCGAGLDEDMRFCPNCGKPFEGGKVNPHIAGTPTAKLDVAERKTPAAAPEKPKKRGVLLTVIVAVIVMVVLGGLFASGTVGPKPTTKPTPEPALPFSDDIDAIEAASESVVMLTCYNQNGELYATGSGFAVFEDGIIVTNYHVIDEKVHRITAETESGASFSCSTVLAYDAEKDIAILKANRQPGLALLTPGDSAALRKGEKVVAVGSPLGLINSVSTGVFSGYIDDKAGKLLQFTAAISHGSSGGALFNDAGEVVGITFASLEAGQSLNLAVPMSEVQTLYEQKVSHREKALNLYSWGGYFAEDSYGFFDTIKGFERWYQETYGETAKVNYTTFASNEDLYEQVSSGMVSYDVIIPTDYMIARMRENDMLLPLNFDNIPNYANIDESFRGLYYDPDNQYTVPYTYGVVGVIYNANAVDKADAQGWDLLWNEKYKGEILQFNNSRDAFGTAQYKLGLDVNDTDHASWDKALAELKKQAPLVKSYVMDEIYNMMESGEAAIGAYYAGDYFTMLDAQADGVDLKFYYPEVTNYFVDAMCIPSCCQDQELAEIFINYMLSPEPAIANAELIYFPSPNSTVYTNPQYRKDMGKEAMEILYGKSKDFNLMFNKNAYRSLDEETLTYINTLWQRLF